jgi:hypothetical protein
VCGVHYIYKTTEANILGEFYNEIHNETVINNTFLSVNVIFLFSAAYALLMIKILGSENR